LQLVRFGQRGEQGVNMPELHVLDAGESPADPENNIVVTEVIRAPGNPEYMLTVTIDGAPVVTAGPFPDRDTAVDQANEEAEHYALHPIYFRQELS
jgi:hypothetical protein